MKKDSRGSRGGHQSKLVEGSGKRPWKKVVVDVCSCRVGRRKDVKEKGGTTFIDTSLQKIGTHKYRKNRNIM